MPDFFFAQLIELGFFFRNSQAPPGAAPFSMPILFSKKLFFFAIPLTYFKLFVFFYCFFGRLAVSYTISSLFINLL